MFGGWFDFEVVVSGFRLFHVLVTTTFLAAEKVGAFT